MKSSLLLLCGLSLLWGHSSAVADQKPNVLIFYIDDMAWAQPACYGGKMAPTPNIDALAAGGVRFTDGYVSACVCSPSRVGLMTGRYQARSGHDANPNRPGTELVLSETTMAQRMKAAGYATGIVGKWHLGDGAAYLPGARGFDTAFGSVGNLGEGKGPAFYRDAAPVADPDGAPITSPIYARESVSFIEAHKDKPWFLYLAFNAVHAPHVASPAWLDKFKNLDRHDQVSSDPGEQNDLSAEKPERARELQTLFDQWNATMQPPRWEDKRWNGEEDRKTSKMAKKEKKKANK